MKKVIFVGGTSFSGSTFFHMALANDQQGFACGEIRWLFNPIRRNHMNLTCGCGDKNCRIWQQVQKKGEMNLYETVFELFPEVQFIVDSSKNPFWIRHQSDHLIKRNIEVKNILIWKTPLEFASSAKKRNRFKSWDKDWINYHRLYFSMIKDWKAVKYYELTNNENPLRKACEYLEIPFFPGKGEYWKKTYHVLGGNHSARFHLYSGDMAKDQSAKTIHKEPMNLYRSIYYKKIEEQSLQEIVQQKVNNSKRFQSILDLLDAYDVLSESRPLTEMQDVQLSAPIVQLKKIKHLVNSRIGKYRYGRHES